MPLKRFSGFLTLLTAGQLEWRTKMIGSRDMHILSDSIKIGLLMHVMLIAHN